jgi:hypothetical protein
MPLVEPVMIATRPSSPREGRIGPAGIPLAVLIVIPLLQSCDPMQPR